MDYELKMQVKSNFEHAFIVQCLSPVVQSLLLSLGMLVMRVWNEEPSPQPGSRINWERDGILVQEGIGKGAVFYIKIPQSRMHS